jgi:hypothetical protein
MSVADRQRRRRQREKAGLVCVTVEIDPSVAGDLLREGGLIDPLTEDDPATLAVGVAKLIRTLTVTRDNAECENVFQSAQMICPFCRRTLSR